MNKGGPKGKYLDWITNEGLVKLEGWAMDGLTDEQIAKNIGIAPRTLYEWKDRFPQLSQSLKRGKDVVDREVENALLKRALGYGYSEKKYEMVKTGEEEYYLKQKIAVQKYKLANPEATREEILLVEKSVPKYEPFLVEEKTKEVAPDTTAAIFWLKNRKPAQWRDKQQVEHSGSMNINNPLEGLSTEDLKKLIDK